MSYKTILVHCDASNSVARRLDVAAELAARFDGHFIGAHPRSPFEVPVYLDAGSGFPMDDFIASYQEAVKADEAAASIAFAKAIKGKTLSAEWRVVDGYADAQMIVQARYADLAVVGQSEAEQKAATPTDLPEVVALATGRARSGGATYWRATAAG